MERRRFLKIGAGGVLATVTGNHAWSQGRSDLSRLIVGFPPGGMVDTVARIIAEPLRSKLGATLIIENKPGAAGQIAVVSVKDAPADGQTMLLTPSAMLVIYPFIYPQLRYDPLLSLAPVIPVTNIYAVLAVGPRHPASNIHEFIEWTKQYPKSATIGTPAAGSGPHFVGVMLANQANSAPLFAHYRGDPPVWQDVMGGSIAAGVGTVVTSAPLHRAGRLRVLAVSGPSRSPQLPGVPTFNEVGFDIPAVEWLGLFVPSQTPAAVITTLNQVVTEALASPGLQETFAKLGAEPTGSTPGEFKSLIKKDLAFWGPVVKSSGFTVES